MVTVAFFHTFLLLFGFKLPTPIDAMLLIGSGFANAIAQYYWTQALHLAPTTAVSPFYYFLLVWALLIDFVVWGEIPTLALLIGSGIVVVSGLFLLWHEAHRKAASPRESGIAEDVPSSSRLQTLRVVSERRTNAAH
jgi:drug/metabolite transporter (DMT)-like permease